MCVICIIDLRGGVSCVGNFGFRNVTIKPHRESEVRDAGGASFKWHARDTAFIDFINERVRTRQLEIIVCWSVAALR